MFSVSFQVEALNNISNLAFPSISYVSSVTHPLLRPILQAGDILLCLGMNISPREVDLIRLIQVRFRHREGFRVAYGQGCPSPAHLSQQKRFDPQIRRQEKLLMVGVLIREA